ncbi:MAG: dTMP kinase [Phycisphaerae bacterium]|nr:dTMP kinase [Phycisphaerae bacterium]
MTVAEKLRGRFVVFDGPDGCGKGTQLVRLRKHLEAAGLDVVGAIDPGGTTIGDRIRAILLNYDLSTMDVRCETLLFMASRAQLVGEVVEPALRAGQTVLCDRFVSATCAYQGAAGADPKRIIEIAHHAVGWTWPDLTVVIDVPAEEGLERAGQRAKASGGPDAMETRPLTFHRAVRENFLALPGLYPKPVLIVDGRGTIDAVHQRITEAISGADF